MFTDSRSFLRFYVLLLISFQTSVGLRWVKQYNRASPHADGGKICDVSRMKAETLCLMQYRGKSGDGKLTVERLLRLRLKSKGEWTLEGCDAGLLPDLFGSYIRSIGTPFSRTTFRVTWAADAFLCTNSDCDVVLDLRWLDSKNDSLGAIVHMLPDGRLGFGLNYREDPSFNASKAHIVQIPLNENKTTANHHRGQRQHQSRRSRVIYKSKAVPVSSNTTKFDLFSLRNTALLERMNPSATPYVGRALYGRDTCHLFIFPNMKWYSKFVRIKKELRCTQPSEVSLIYAPVRGGGAVYCDELSQQTVTSGAGCYNSSWVSVANTINDEDLLIKTTTMNISGIEFQVLSTFEAKGREKGQSDHGSAFSRALRGIMEDAKANRPSTCLKTPRRVVHRADQKLNHNITLVKCEDLQSLVDLNSTTELREKDKTIQDFVSTMYIEMPRTPNIIGIAGYERMDLRTVHNSLDEVEQDLLRKVQELEDQFSTRLSDTNTVCGAGAGFAVALLAIILAWPGIKDSVERYSKNLGYLKAPIELVYVVIVLALNAGLLFPVILDEAVTRENLQGVELQILQNTARIGGYGDYHFAMLTNLRFEPIRELKVWIFYALLLLVCVILLILAVQEGRLSRLKKSSPSSSPREGNSLRSAHEHGALAVPGSFTSNHWQVGAATDVREAIDV